jgi:hypothetical protein
MEKTEELNEDIITNVVREFLEGKEDGNWHAEKTKQAKLHSHGEDLHLIGGKRNSEYFIIECKGKSYAKSSKSIDETVWLYALGQLITRMTVKRVNETGTLNRAYKYGIGLHEDSAKIARRRIPHEIAKTLNLYIFSVDNDKKVTMYSPSEIGNL